MRRSLETKDRIMGEAMRLVADKGYSAVTTREIAAAAGVSEGTIFKYFSTKDELLKTLVLHTIDKLYNYSVNEAIPQTMVQDEGQGADRLLKDLIEERFTFFRENASALKVIFQEAMVNRTVQEIFKDKVWQKIVEITDRIFDDGKREGYFKQIDNYFLRKALFGMLFFSTIFEDIIEVEKGKKFPIEEQRKQMVQILFEGIGEA